MVMNGGVAARPREAGHEAAADGVGNVQKNDRDGARLLPQSPRGGCAMRKDQVGLQCDELLRQSLSCLGVAGRRPANVDLDVAALRPLEPRERLPKRCDEGLSFPVALRVGHQHADPPQLVRGLRVPGKRPSCRCRRTAKGSDEFAPPHESSTHDLGLPIDGSRPLLRQLAGKQGAYPRIDPTVFRYQWLCSLGDRQTQCERASIRLLLRVNESTPLAVRGPHHRSPAIT